jgi:hypothetical protein
MPTKNYLIANNYVIYSHITGHITSDAIRTASEEQAAWLNQLDHPCYLLNDTRNVKSVPNNLLQVRDATKEVFSHPNLVMTVVYGTKETPIFNFMVKPLMLMFKTKIRFVSTQEEAIQIILGDFPELDPLLIEDIRKIQASENVF